VYLRVLEGGLLRPGDEVAVEPAVQERTCSVKDGSTTGAALICSACYYLLDAAATSAQELPAGYRCPDCGAGRDAVVPSAGFRPSS
jgi:hypothetical protein